MGRRPLDHSLLLVRLTHTTYTDRKTQRLMARIAIRIRHLQQEMEENPRVVQERLGYSHVSITLGTFEHVTPTMQQQAIARLDARFGKQREATHGS